MSKYEIHQLSTKQKEDIERNMDADKPVKLNLENKRLILVHYYLYITYILQIFYLIWISNILRNIQNIEGLI